MKEEKNKVNFDLSVLTLQELVKTYQEVSSFISFLETKKQPEDKKKKGAKK